MKKKLISIMIILFIIISVVVYYFIFINYDMYEMPKDVSITIKENDFNIYDKHMTYELYDIKEGIPINEKELLINNEIGKYVYTLEYIYKKRKYKYDINYTVSDKTPPVFINAPSVLKMEVSENAEICNKLVYADNYDNIPRCMIKGEYDKTKIGTYKNLEYIIADSSNNIIQKSFTLEIVNKIHNSKSNPKKYVYLDEIINKYKTDNTSIGIDISKWQGNVDFNKVKEAGVEFVIMRIGRQNSPDEEIEMDIKFKEYYQAVKKIGLPIGIYIYNTAVSEKSAKDVARWVIKNLNGDKLDFPIAYDWEDWSHFMNYKISLHTLSETYKVFEKELNNNGYDSMLYSSKFYLENAWMDYDDSKIWLAHYTDKTDYKGKYLMWQMTSSAKIDGITDNTVDIDILYK